MTGPVRHQENANKARAELATVKAQASELIGGLVCLVKSMYVFGDFAGVLHNGRPMEDVVADLVGASTATEMLAALNETQPA